MEDVKTNFTFSPKENENLLAKYDSHTDTADSLGMNKDESTDDSTNNELSSFKVPILPSPTTLSQVDVSKTTLSPAVSDQSESHLIGNFSIIQNDSTEVDGSATLPELAKVDTFKLSPAEQIRQSLIPYKEPPWGGIADKQYKFEVLKDGTIIDNVDLTQQSYYVFGRLPSCDVTMEHPSLSRYHAVVQYCSTPNSTDDYERGWYLYDLDSTHGTWINKNKVSPNRYYRIRVGHVVKFGGSKRLNILQGPDDDCDEESELSISEMKEQRERQKSEAAVLKQAELAEEENKLQQMKAKEHSIGCTWGMDEEDAFEVSDDNPFAGFNPENEELYLDDPKKTLKGYFEREGYEEPEYDVSDGGAGKYRCRVELPIDNSSGQPIVAESVASGKKKEAVLACALEACRILDKHGVLRASKHESHKRKKKNWEYDDFYDSDDDTFLDRTGTIEKKREIRMQKAGKGDDKAETHDSLSEKHLAILSEIAEIESKLEEAKRESIAAQSDEVDALDAYMLSIKSGAMDTKTKMKLKGQLLLLRQEEMKLRRLVNIAKPAALPELKKHPIDQRNIKLSLPMFGRMKGVQKYVRKPVPEKPIGEMITNEEDNIEEEEDEDEEITKTTSVMTDIDSTKLSTQTVMKTSDSSKRVESSQQKVQQQKLLENKSSTSSHVLQVDSVKVKGPSLPPKTDELNPSKTQHSRMALHSEQSSNEGDLSTEPGQLKRKHSEDFKKKKMLNLGQMSKIYDQSDPDYAVWLPPKNQAGDGKTHLNDKYGY